MTHELDDLADRHFRPDPQGILAAPTEARQARVLIAIAPAMAATKAGQDAIWMLANLICRQFKLVTGIALDIPPDVALLPRVAAFGEARTLKEAITNCISLVAGRHVQIDEQAAAPEGTYPIEIFIGRPAGAPRAAVRLIVFADGWRLFLGHAFPFDELPRSDITFGPYLAACFAAGEVFKRLRGMKPGKGESIGEGHELCLSLWTTRTAAAWNQLDRDPSLGRTDFPPLYFAGAGAVAEAAAISIAGLPDTTGHVTVIDPEPLDLSNDNRYALATLDDDEMEKAPFMADFLARREFTEYRYVGTWQDYVSRRGRPPNSADLDALEATFRYRLILSCVDDNAARHAIQNLWPDLIIGGSTHGLTAKAITYDMLGDQLCLKCYNPVIERNELVNKRLEDARSMDPEARAKFFTELGIDPLKAEAHLHNPRCGQLSEQDLNRFAAGDPMMSVGFVSVAAGVLLAAQVLRLVHFGREHLVESGPILTANFYRPGLRWLRSLPEEGCDCVPRRVNDWTCRWGRREAF
jgi:molybdopterin/thiamine biosynthesis adenylyltransferase